MTKLIDIIYLCIIIVEQFYTSFAASHAFSVSKILQLQKNETESPFADDDITYNSSSDVEELFFEQTLDHFALHPSSPEQDRTFKQRYFYTSRFVKHKKDSNQIDKHHNIRQRESHYESKKNYDGETFAFLCVGGEGPSLTKSVLIDSVHCTGDMIEVASRLSKELKANIHLFALEHRYYGKSYPTFLDGSSPVSNSNLVYLSSRQALVDLATFIQFSKQEYGLGEHVQWIAFGGSYPGMLAAWSRLKFPHLVHAAVSNSAPVEVILDFDEYKNVVANDLKNEMIGGSTECLNVVQNGHYEIAQILSDNTYEAREKVATLFNICGGEESLQVQKNVNSFLGDGVIEIPAQENDPSCEDDLCNIGKICDFLTSESSYSSMEKLANISKKQTQGCKDIDWEAMIDFLSSDGAAVEGTRSWLYQTCSEVGFYQTCHSDSLCPFGKGYHNLDADFEICERAYGIDAEMVTKNVQDTLTYYGGWDMEGSRILSVNGDVDPWSKMSMSNHKSDNKDLPSYWSIGASHHFWTHQVKESDNANIQNTRDNIYNWVKLELDNDREKRLDILLDKKESIASTVERI